MPKCKNGSRRHSTTGRCRKKSKTAKNVTRSKRSTPVSNAEGSSVPKLKWIDHLKMCTKKFDIKYGKAMTDPRCRKLYDESR